MTEPEALEPVDVAAPRLPRDVLLLRLVVGVVLGALLLTVLWLGYRYALSPAAIRHPTPAHIHLRLQVINDHNAVNFAAPAFQTAFNQDICTAALTKEPFHFHDGVGQFVHVHWAHMTGGLLLKHYGWNFLGGPDTALGYRFNGLRWPVAVPIHGRALPLPSPEFHYYVYVGNASTSVQRSWNDWLHQDLATFFNGMPPATTGASEAGAAHLNHVVGNVVIFAQRDQPTAQEVNDRFSQLLPLPTSSCSG